MYSHQPEGVPRPFKPATEGSKHRSRSVGDSLTLGGRLGFRFSWADVDDEDHGPDAWNQESSPDEVSGADEVRSVDVGLQSPLVVSGVQVLEGVSDPDQGSLLEYSAEASGLMEPPSVGGAQVVEDVPNPGRGPILDPALGDVPCLESLQASGVPQASRVLSNLQVPQATVLNPAVGEVPCLESLQASGVPQASRVLSNPQVPQATILNPAVGEVPCLESLPASGVPRASRVRSDPSSAAGHFSRSRVSSLRSASDFACSVKVSGAAGYL